ncbi:hypothetical protein [Piscinibacter sakaiensis]|uniref:hypothetical protein n=1 Tax=Piscinibacter sakaiensis TaxID=1547922 RepID=UPI003AAF998F
MNQAPLHRWRWAGVIAALLLVFVAWYQPLQALADEQTDAGLKRAVITFASARTLNGLISVVQGTELSVQPLGVGVTLTLGQILDPINDLIEQFSSLMLFASVAFGVQKMLLAIGGHWAVSTAVSIVAIAWAALLLTGRRYRWLTRLVLVLLMIRLAIPLATIGSDFVFEQLMADEYRSGQQSLLTTSKQLDTMTPKPDVEPGEQPAEGWFGKLKRGAEALKQGIGSRLLPTVDYDAIRKAAEELPEKIIRLIVIFLMQTVALPLLLVWALYVLAFGAGSLADRGPVRRPGTR